MTDLHPQPSRAGTDRLGAEHSRSRRGVTFVALSLVLALLGTMLTPTLAGASRSSGSVVVANRGSGDISVINTSTLAVETMDLPGDAEPMYVNHDRRHGQVLVGDRASSTVVALDDKTYEVIGSVAVGDGVFHQWYDQTVRQLWVVGDTSQTVTVVDTRDLTVLATIDIPTELVDRGGKPHDVFVSGRFAFVSILGVDGDTGVVLRYSTHRFRETGRITTGDDPHLFVTGNRLYVASQDGASVTRYNSRTLKEMSSFDVPSAHGIFVTDRREILVTNIAGGGTDAVWELNQRLTKTRGISDTPHPTPHNLTVDRNRQAWVTHSGATADKVSIIDLERMGFGDVTSVTVGTNPFGLAFVKS